MVTTEISELNAAQALLHTGAFDDAMSRFSECLSLNPACAAAYQGRAIAHFQCKEWALAMADFTEAKRLDADDPENWVGLAMSLAMDNRIYAAVALFEDLLARRPDYARGHLQLGLLYYQLQATHKGRECLERALTCRPSLAERRLIARVLGEQQQLDHKRYYRPDFEALHRSRR